MSEDEDRDPKRESDDRSRAETPVDTATFLVSCPDQKGLVASLAQVFYGHGANILDSDQHVDPQAGHFFQRIRVDLRDLRTDRFTLKAAVSEVAERFGMRWRWAEAKDLPRLAIFVSRYDHCLFDLLWRHRAKELRCEVPLVVSNHPDLRHVAEQFGIPFEVLPATEDRAARDAHAAALLEAYRINTVVLARYMQVLSEDFVDRYRDQIINIHHSFLPAFVGSKPYHRAHERGVKLIGATAHYVTTDLDEGPIIEQDVVRCSHRDSIADLVRKGRDLEKLVLSRAVRSHVEDRVLVYENKTVVFE